ncbi:MAG: PQQ-dependent sugar dehydrogenase [Acidimicrobiia bacterium]|nr:PQQ-dependent sugar dehydrogenase [Acidimicrobiia bacterium]
MSARVWSGLDSRGMRGVRTSLVVLGLLFVAFAVVNGTRSVWAANPPPDFADVVIADEIFAPVQLAMAPDGRLIVLTDSGLAQLIKDDQLQGTPFFDIRSQVEDNGDRGLFSMAFDNNFAVNGFVYVMYTFDTNGVDDGIGATRLSRMTVTGDTASNEVVLFEDFPAADVLLHYGGAVEMGPDGKLYVTVGDHLIGANGQDRTNLKGTVLRLNTDGSIPTDNPFYTELTGTNRAIYAYGLRNPWQTAKHPITGEIFISDVGSSDYEELNVLAPGANYGWFIAEGPKDPNDPAQASFVDPLWAFPHFGVEQGAPFEGCAIIGGSFYETPNPTFPNEYRGQYFTGDYCTGRIVTVDPDTGQASVFMDGFVEMVDMAVSPTNGDLYYIDRSFNGDNVFPKGGVGKVTYTGVQTDITITTAPSDVSTAVGGDASFFVGISAPGNVTYQWSRDGQPIPGAVDARYTLNNVSAADDLAEFTVEISNGQQSIESDPAVLRITNNAVPVPTIDAVTGADGGYRAGDPIGFSGSATDAEDGVIPAADLRWEIRLNHDDHDHALANGVVGDTGSFTVPPAIETDTNVWVTLYLTAVDSEGTSTTVTQRVDPRIVTVTLDTDPAGLDVTLEGGAQQAPFSFDSVSGVDREIGAPAQQTAGGITYTFASWSDGLARNEIRTTPNADVTWTATYTGGGGGDICTVTELGGGVRVSWQDKPRTEVIRNDGGWVTTPPAGTLTYDDPNGSTDEGWLVRRSGVDEICEIVGDPPPPPPPTPACVVTELGGGVLIDWDPVENENRFAIRADDSWVITVTDVTSYEYTEGTLDQTFVLRFNRGDGREEIACTNEGEPPPPPPPDGCVVVAVGAGVTVTWQDLPGTEIIRNTDGWVATPPAGTLSYSVPNASVDDGWLIRRTRGGGDEICAIG